jgi:two-component system cell cycle sensor histidine kinase/response regulator CckA
VETREDYLAALDKYHPALIVSDFKLPHFDGLTALRLALERCPDVPFIILTGSMNEDTAVECMKAGAWDYVIKEHVKRLGPAVESALERQRVRNPFLVELTGYSRDEFLEKHLWEIITERKHGSEAGAREARRAAAWRRRAMEAIGLLAGGVAHDFNNLLSVILCCTEFAMERVREDDRSRENSLEVKKAGERAVALTRQLLAFSRKQVLQPVVLNLNQIAAGVEKMLRRILGEDIDYVQVLAPHLGAVRADPGQIEQVLMNLVVNARDAMPEGGKLTIETPTWISTRSTPRATWP